MKKTITETKSPLTPERRAENMRLREAATAGPYLVDPEKPHTVRCIDGAFIGSLLYNTNTDDVHYIVAACNDLPLYEAEIVRLQAEIAALKAELSAVREDAERYRYIRSHKACIALYDLFGVTTATKFEQQLDAAIDAARRE